jgi:hypothetical protein
MVSLLVAKTDRGGMKKMYRPPFGYEVTEEGNLIPIEDDLELLGEVRDMLESKAISLRDGALYLSYKGSRSITHEGLRQRLTKPVRLDDNNPSP